MGTSNGFLGTKGFWSDSPGTITASSWCLVDTLRLNDSDDSNYLEIVWNEDDSSDRQLNLAVSAGTRAFTISGDSTINQDVSTGGSPSFSAITTLTTDLSVANGGTGVSTFTSNGVLYGNAGSAIQVTAQGAANTVLTANAGAPSFSATPTVTSLTATTLYGSLDTNVAAAGLTISGATISTDGSDANIPLVANGKGTGGLQTTLFGVGTATVPHGATGNCLIAIEGANASDSGPHVQFTTASDDYPLLSFVPWQHDAVSIGFDAYDKTGGAWGSSDAGSNFVISKESDELRVYYNTGDAQGDTIAWDGTALAITNAGITKITKLGVGSSTVPHGAVGGGIIAVEGANASAAGPHAQFTTASDDYPVMQLWNWAHDTIGLLFDMYHDGAFKSSDAGSNFAIVKNSDELYIGVDDTVTAGNAVTLNQAFIVDKNSIIRKPLQPAFHAYNSSADAGQTKGASVTIECDTERFDNNSDFNNSTDTLTSPVTGKWDLKLAITIYNINAATRAEGAIVTSNATYDLWSLNPSTLISSGANVFRQCGSCTADMDAADTAHGQSIVDGGTSTYDIFGNANSPTCFSGSLIC